MAERKALRGADGEQRPRARRHPPRQRPRRESAAAWTLPRTLLLPAFALAYLGMVWRWGFAPLVPLAYLGLSLLTFVAYALDKSAAIAGRWRTKEETLHLMALAGGWPGALLAQQLLRHKTAKRGFVAVFWGTVGLNVVGLVAWHAAGRPLLG